MTETQQFMNQFPTTPFEKGATILLREETPEIVYGIKSGFVKGYDIDDSGSEQLVWLGARGDVFPIVWAFSLSPNVQYFYSAFTDVEVYRVKRDAFLSFLHQNQVALLEVTKRLTKRFADAMRHLNAAEKTKADKKIIHTLYFLSLRFGHIDDDSKSDKREVRLPITHQDIANLLGLTRETVTVELKKLRNSGLIDYDKTRFTIHQDKLERLL